jgi:hypothetical protein
VQENLGTGHSTATINSIDRLSPVGRLRVLANGSNMEVQRIANQTPLVKFGIGARSRRSSAIA